MKLIIIITISLLSIYSCCSKKNIPNNSNEDLTNMTIDAMHLKPYMESLEKWNSLKAKHNNSYKYTVTFQSFTGYSSRTIITIEEGKIIRREFYELDLLNHQKPNLPESPKYVESENEINKNNEGYPAISIDEVYKNRIEKHLKLNEQKNNITFKVDKLGLLNVCGYTPKNCMDDCFIGTSIAEIKWGKD